MPRAIAEYKGLGTLVRENRTTLTATMKPASGLLWFDIHTDGTIRLTELLPSGGTEHVRVDEDAAQGHFALLGKLGSALADLKQIRINTARDLEEDFLMLMREAAEENINWRKAMLSAMLRAKRGEG